MGDKIAVTRRSLLHAGWRGALLAGAAGSGLPFFSEPARAANFQSRALLCIFLVGGNDSANMFVPLDRSAYWEYSRIRGSLALSETELLRVEVPASGAAYGFHPALPTVADKFQLGKVAVVANAGEPARPESHTVPFLTYLPDGYFVPEWAAAFVKPATHANRFRSGLVLLTPDWQFGGAPSIDPPSLTKMIPRESASVPFPATSLGRQLRQAAYLIREAPDAGFGRQVYVATLAGFDTHAQQTAIQSRLFEQLDSALSAFLRAADVLGISNRLIVYTDTEFGRTLKPNAYSGTDKGWGAHQLVIGDAVQGATVFGSVPEMRLGGPVDATGTGVWVPTTSRERMMLPLASWLGLTGSELRVAFPSAAEPGLNLLV